MHLVEHRSWSLVKITRNAIQSFFQYVLERPWEYVPIVNPGAAALPLVYGSPTTIKK